MSSGPRISSHPPGVPAIGTVIADKYRVERVLGVGGMGIVVAARHLHLDELVAIKLMSPAVLGNEDAVARFLAEARAVVRIKSEFVARVSDVDRLDSGELYIVMEYLEGEDLDAWLSKRGPFSIEQASEFVIQACEALAEAHALGIVHRDLKPANLFCTRRADHLLAIKVLDFGISKTTGNTLMPRTTDPSAVMGSPSYMPPEQLASTHSVDARGDIWALGAILYELISGRLPFVADSISGVMLRVAMQPPPPLGEAPPGLEGVILRCLQKDPEHRYPEVAALAEALAEFAPARAQGSVARVRRIVEASGVPLGETSGDPLNEASAVPLACSLLENGASSAPKLASDDPDNRTHTSFGNAAMVNAGSARKAWLGLAGLLLILCAWLVFDAFAPNRAASSRGLIPGQGSAAKPRASTVQHVEADTSAKVGPTSKSEVRIVHASVEAVSTSSAQPTGASGAAGTVKATPPSGLPRHSLRKIDELIMDRQ